MIKVVCVMVRANVPYTTDYVVRLRNAVRRTLPRNHEFVVITDQPFQVGLEFKKDRDVKVIPHAHLAGIPGWWAKLQVFRLTGPVLYLDLDVLTVASLAEVVDFPLGDAAIALVPHAGTFEGRDGKKVVKNYNSSIMWMPEASRLRFLHDEWDIGVANRLWGDQDWIGERLQDTAVKMPLEWFPRLSEISQYRGRPIIPPEAKIILCKKPKNHEAAAKWAWFREMWQ